MRQRHISYVLIFTFLFFSFFSYAETLFDNNRTKYGIVVSVDASEEEKSAAQELSKYLEEISGAKFLITSKPQKKKNIYVGLNKFTEKKLGRISLDDNLGSYTYISKKGNIYIYGDKNYGTANGVFSFLEDELGVKWYTPDYTFVPKINLYSFDHLYVKSGPAFLYREQMYLISDNPEWCTHNKESNRSISKVINGTPLFYGVHTLGKFIPESKYFNDHPEYFALINFRRQKNSQLCLSNPDVLNICIEEIEKTIEAHPQYLVYDVSQNDNQRYCKCKNCTEIAKKYGGQSGLLIWFVNQIAEQIREKYPQKYIGTLAYQYSRSVPSNIIPSPNVFIRLCDIECCFAHALNSNCPHNRSFYKDITEWAAITNNLVLWDYVVDFRHFFPTWPNFHSIENNYRFFNELGLKGIMAEGNYCSYGGDFEEMKSWVISKLLWNPQKDVDKLCEEFIYAYYGEAADFIWEYYLLCQSLIKGDTHLFVFDDITNPIYSTDFICKAESILNDALCAVTGNEDLIHRVQKVLIQVKYLSIYKNKEESIRKGDWEILIDIAKQQNLKPSESVSLETFIQNFKK